MRQKGAANGAARTAEGERRATFPARPKSGTPGLAARRFEEELLERFVLRDHCPGASPAADRPLRDRPGTGPSRFRRPEQIVCRVCFAQAFGFASGLLRAQHPVEFLLKPFDEIRASTWSARHRIAAQPLHRRFVQTFSKPAAPALHSTGFPIPDFGKNYDLYSAAHKQLRPGAELNRTPTASPTASPDTLPMKRRCLFKVTL